MRPPEETLFGLDARRVKLRRPIARPLFRQSCGVNDSQVFGRAAVSRKSSGRGRPPMAHITCEFSLLRQSWASFLLMDCVSCTFSRRRSWLQRGDVARRPGPELAVACCPAQQRMPDFCHMSLGLRMCRSVCAVVSRRTASARIEVRHMATLLSIRLIAVSDRDLSRLPTRQP
jgi:hypothetical protein